jgi:phosphoribosylaminoimidazole-succinocarboxamide synthase
VGDHDENITFEQTVEMIGLDLATRIRDISIRHLQGRGDIALAKGIIIADTKFEFGLDTDGTLVLMDEVLTPDSSRYWPAKATRKAATRPALTSSLCATGWSMRRWTASPGAKPRPRRGCPMR